MGVVAVPEIDVFFTRWATWHKGTQLRGLMPNRTPFSGSHSTFWWLSAHLPCSFEWSSTSAWGFAWGHCRLHNCSLSKNIFGWDHGNTGVCICHLHLEVKIPTKASVHEYRYSRFSQCSYTWTWCNCFVFRMRKCSNFYFFSFYFFCQWFSGVCCWLCWLTSSNGWWTHIYNFYVVFTALVCTSCICVKCI